MFGCTTQLCYHSPYLKSIKPTWRKQALLGNVEGGTHFMKKLLALISLGLLLFALGCPPSTPPADDNSGDTAGTQTDTGGDQMDNTGATDTDMTGDTSGDDGMEAGDDDDSTESGDDDEGMDGDDGDAEKPGH